MKRSYLTLENHGKWFKTLKKLGYHKLFASGCCHCAAHALLPADCFDDPHWHKVHSNSTNLRNSHILRMMPKMILRFKKLDKSGKLGNYRFKGDAGLDLFSVENIVLTPGKSNWVRTGIAVEIPKRCVGFIKEKSGLAQIFAVGAGVIDSSYRGEVKVWVRNLGNKELKIRKGQAIAQLVILPFVPVQTEEVLELSPTERSNKGFGGLQDLIHKEGGKAT